MIINRNVSYSVTINKLLDADLFATISPYSISNRNTQDVGSAFDLMAFELNHSIIDVTVASKIKFTLKSNALNINNIGDITTFLKTLAGRTITVQSSFTTISNPQSGEFKQTFNTKTVYSGFISAYPESVTIKNGSTFTLQCKGILGQLDKISSNSSWDDATKTYGNIFISNVSNILTRFNLNKLMSYRTLLKQDIIYFDGSAKPLPNKLWAFLLPQLSRLAIMNQVLAPYSRIFYQAENGNVYVRPLFYDDDAESGYNVDFSVNNEGHAMLASSTNNAPTTPNRVDVSFTPQLPTAQFNAPNTTSEIFASCPRINHASNTIESQTIGDLDYTKIYATSTRLYNSQVFQMPMIQTISIDNSLVLNPQGILNPLMALYGSKDLGISNINKTSIPQFNTIPLLYSQLYLAQINAANYNAVIQYNYASVMHLNGALGRIINISNVLSLDYPRMLVSDTKLTMTQEEGSNYTVTTVPLLSITPTWYSLQGKSY